MRTSPSGPTKRKLQIGQPLPLLALEAAKLDHATRARIPAIEAHLTAAQKALARAKNVTERAYWEEAVHHYQSALDTLRYSPYGDDRQPAGRD